MDPILFMGIENVEDVSNSEEEAPAEKSDCTKNPNRDDDRRLFQVFGNFWCKNTLDFWAKKSK